MLSLETASSYTGRLIGTRREVELPFRGEGFYSFLTDEGSGGVPVDILSVE